MKRIVVVAPMRRVAMMAATVVLVAGCGAGQVRLVTAPGDELPMTDAVASAQAVRSVNVTADCSSATFDLTGFSEGDWGSFGFGASPPYAIRFEGGSLHKTVRRVEVSGIDLSWSIIVYPPTGLVPLEERYGVVTGC